jgi:hypothetical protein
MQQEDQIAVQEPRVPLDENAEKEEKHFTFVAHTLKRNP